MCPFTDWSVGIGDAPHPTPKAETRVAIIMNQNGAYHQYQRGGPTKDFANPRLFNGDGKFGNFLVKGQSYGDHNYDDIGALLEYEPLGTGVGTDTMKICNLGPSSLRVKAIWGILHGDIPN